MQPLADCMAPGSMLLLAAGRIAHCCGPVLDFPCPYVRLSFANATEADLEEGMARLAQVLHSFQKAQQLAAKQGPASTLLPVDEPQGASIVG